MNEEKIILRCPMCSNMDLLRKINGSFLCHNCQTEFTIKKLSGIVEPMKERGFGLKGYYPKIPVPLKLKALVVLCRPFTLLPAFLAGIIGVLLPLLKTNVSIFTGFFSAVYAGVTLALLQAVGQITNQIYDVEIDRIAKPYRPLVQGLITREEAESVAFILSFFALARAYFLSPIFGGFATLLLFFAVFYNVPPFRMKRFTWLGNLWLGISRGLIPFLAGWCIYGSLYDIEPWVFGIFCGLWCFALNCTKDFPDIEADKKFNIPTLPVRYGVEKATNMMTLLSTYPFIFLLYVVYFVSTKFLSLFTIAGLLPLIIYGLKMKSPITENSIAWVGFYAGICLTYLLAIPICTP